MQQILAYHTDPCMTMIGLFKETEKEIEIFQIFHITSRQ